MIKFGYAFSFFVIIFDQITKYIIIGYLEGAFSPITSFFNLVYVFNTGISFSFFSSDAPWAPIVFSLVGCVFVLVLTFWLKKAENRLHASGLGLIIGGALGNIIDRLAHGAVFDFLDFHAYGYHFPAFNFADTSIFLGVFLVLIDNIFFQGNKKDVSQ